MEGDLIDFTREIPVQQENHQPETGPPASVEQQILETRARRMRISQGEDLDEGEEEENDFVNCDNDESMSVESTVSAMLNSVEEISRTGTNGRLEEIEETEEELRGKLIEDLENKKQINNVSPMRKNPSALSNLLPVPTGGSMQIDTEENWDRELAVEPYRPPVRPGLRIQRVVEVQEEVRVTSVEVSEVSAGGGARQRRRNPNYQFTTDDYFSPNLPSRSPSPIFGPNNVVRRVQSQP